MFNHNTVYGKYTTTTPEPFQFHLTLLHLKTFFSLETMRVLVSPFPTLLQENGSYPGFFFVPFELNNARFNEAQIESEVAKTLVYCKSSFFRKSPP